MNQKLKTACFITFISLFACNSDKKSKNEQLTPIKEHKVISSKNQFNNYWYSGKAELNSYELKQSRYGEIRDGEVILVFVTEPFSLNKQVKLDNAKEAGSDKVSVMKLNQIRRFTTGIYDYSIINTTFTPIDSRKHPHTLKLNTSIQEWCGQTFTQLNLKENSYLVQQFSYFEADGDTETNLPVTLLEDELMTRIRINNGQLPEGELDLIFSTIYSRFTHNKMKAAKAIISKTTTDTTIQYNIKYLNYKRKVSIDVQKEFPYKILAWTEDDGDGQITEARLKKTINEPYWQLKSNSDEAKRREMQLIK
ncbi:septum formation inhibitor Maf [Mariniflexile sp.]|uniref:septum formation inhibitor Maf n=1 Tax=Mariniflexile sp. TaxID=1979402 RepID=UPI0035619138